jgi:ribonuclease VapC
LIVIDTSALIAILSGEPECVELLQRIQAADRCLVSAINLLETRMVLRARYGPNALEDLSRLLAQMRAEVVAVDDALAEAAFRAFETYGKGIHSKARLNICDCVAYALAKQLDAALLFKGDDFPHTDVKLPA